MLDPQRFDTSRFSIMRLQTGDDFAAIIAQTARQIELALIARADKLPIAAVQRQIIIECSSKTRGKGRIKRLQRLDRTGQ